MPDDRIVAPLLSDTQDARAWYKILRMRRIQKQLDDAFQACLTKMEEGADPKDLERFVRALAALKQPEIRALVEECKTLGSDKAAAKSSDDSGRVGAVLQRKMAEATEP